MFDNVGVMVAMLVISKIKCKSNVSQSVLN